MPQTAQQLVQLHMETATEFVASEFGNYFKEIVPLAVKSQHIRFDSPLEELFYLWWIAMQVIQQNVLASLGIEGTWLRHHHIVHLENETYEVDFAFSYGGRYSRQPWTPIAIEVDGHEFHERTRAQVARRDQRDRALQAAGWKVFHFSYAEFMASPLRCVTEVYDFAYEQLLPHGGIDAAMGRVPESVET